jgi:hypothetical protein
MVSPSKAPSSKKEYIGQNAILLTSIIDSEASLSVTPEYQASENEEAV